MTQRDMHQLLDMMTIGMERLNYISLSVLHGDFCRNGYSNLLGGLMTGCIGHINPLHCACSANDVLRLLPRKQAAHRGAESKDIRGGTRDIPLA